MATYKYALLMTLADIAVEVGQDDDSLLSIDTTLIAEKFVQYYWRQSAPYIADAGGGGPSTKFNSGPEARSVCESSTGSWRIW